MYLPINVEDRHWIAAHVNIVTRHVTLYDSSRAATQDWFHFNNCECLTVLFPYLLKVGGFYNHRLELTYNGTPILNAFTISHIDVKQYPQQSISGDCGIFMLNCIKFLSSDRTIDFTQKHIPLFREKYFIEVFHNELSL